MEVFKIIYLYILLYAGAMSLSIPWAWAVQWHPSGEQYGCMVIYSLFTPSNSWRSLWYQEEQGMWHMRAAHYLHSFLQKTSAERGREGGGREGWTGYCFSSFKSSPEHACRGLVNSKQLHNSLNQRSFALQ